MNAVYKINEEKNGIEIGFTDKPGEIIRDEMKKAGYRWHKQKKIWYAKNTPERLALAKRLTNRRESDFINADPMPELELPDVKKIERGGLYDGWEGGNNKKWHTDKELKAFLSADFKAAKIPASIRFNRAGYLTSVTITLKMTAADIRPLEDYQFDISRAAFWVHYQDESGNLTDIHINKLREMPAAEYDALYENIRRTEYELEVIRLKDGGNAHKGYQAALTDDANKRLETARQIVTSYNRDQSNSQVDYFDRDIYDDYKFKFA